ncbi:hypothetical protein U1Q18_008065 [Sarracenia purpurea var. burkii]
MEGSSVQVITRKVTINTNKASAKGMFSMQEVADKGVSPLKPIKDKEGALRFEVRRYLSLITLKKGGCIKKQKQVEEGPIQNQGEGILGKALMTHAKAQAPVTASVGTGVDHSKEWKENADMANLLCDDVLLLTSSISEFLLDI